MADDKPIVVLSPKDLKPGSIAPDGRVVLRSRMWANNKSIIVNTTYEDGTSSAHMWPSGSGWTVDGKTAP